MSSSHSVFGQSIMSFLSFIDKQCVCIVLGHSQDRLDALHERASSTVSGWVFSMGEYLVVALYVNNGGSCFHRTRLC